MTSSTEYRQAARLLLSSPIVDGATDPSGHALVRRHAARLTERFAALAGWRLVVDATGARLFKHPAPGHLPRHRPRSATPGAAVFDPTRWALCCLVLAACEDAEREAVTARSLFDSVVVLASDVLPDGLDPMSFDDRRRFVHAARWAQDVGVLTLVDGTVEGFEAPEGADALWHVNEWILARLVAAETAPSLLADVDLEALDRPYPATEDGARARARHRLFRRLVDEPVTYFDDLDAAEAEAWARSRRSLVDALHDEFGILVEERAEGLVPVDVGAAQTSDDTDLTDIGFPGSGTRHHAALLVCEHLARTGALSPADLESFVADRAHDHATWWSRELASQPAVLARSVVALLTSVGLARVGPDGHVHALPAAARYRATATRGGRAHQEALP